MTAPAEVPPPGGPSARAWLIAGGVVVLLLVAVGTALVLRPADPPTASTSTSVPGTAAGASSGSGPASPGAPPTTITPDALRAKLVDSGIPADEAGCIVDGFVAKGLPLKDSSAPSAADQAVIDAVVGECVKLRAPPELPDAIGVAAPSDYDLPADSIACTVDDITGAMKAAGTLTNRRDKTQAYEIKIEYFDEANELLGSAAGFTGDVAPGQSQTWDALSFDSVATGKKITCKVAAVNYSAFSTK